MQRAGGYTLSGETGEQCLFFCYGKGANGKSTLIEVLAAVTGEYGTAMSTKALMQHKHTSRNGHNEEIANLRGLRFASAVETEEGHKFAESRLKQFTGGDTITASRKYEHSVTFARSSSFSSLRTTVQRLVAQMKVSGDDLKLYRLPSLFLKRSAIQGCWKSCGQSYRVFWRGLCGARLITIVRV